MDFVLLQRLPIKLASEERLTVRLCFFVCHEGYQLGLRVRRKLWSNLFYFFLLDGQLEWPVKETDSTGASKIFVCDKKEASLKNFCFSSTCQNPNYGLNRTF